MFSCELEALQRANVMQNYKIFSEQSQRKALNLPNSVRQKVNSKKQHDRTIKVNNLSELLDKLFCSTVQSSYIYGGLNG
jgi:hypothetical protein